jgi:hypothetical protein
MSSSESIEDLKLSESILDLSLSYLYSTILISKLPRYVEHVDIGLMFRSRNSSEIALSVLPATLRTFKIIPFQYKVPIIADCALPAHLEEWEAQLDWESLDSNFSVPDSLKKINCSAAIFGNQFERIGKSLEHLDTSYIYLEQVHVAKFPISLVSLVVPYSSPEALKYLPQTLTSFSLTSEHSIGVGILNRGVCERLEALKELDCHLHHFESTSCLSAFKSVKKLTITISQEYLVMEEDLFVHLKSPKIEEIDLRLHARICPHWPLWITQLQPHATIRAIYCLYLDPNSGSDDLVIPNYFKSLPPGLTTLIVPPPCLPSEESEAKSIVASEAFLDCFKHFPKGLTNFTLTPPRTGYAQNIRVQSIWLSDDCFAHMPPSLTHLELCQVAGLTHRFWDVIPPNVWTDLMLNSPEESTESQFLSKRMEYVAKFER